MQCRCGTKGFAAVTADTFGAVVHDLVSGLVPVMGLVGTLTHADLAIDAQVLVPVDVKLVVILVDGLEQQGSYPL
jgi:hypothetical protein